MRPLHTAIVVLLVVVLAVDLAAANAVLAVDRTVLNADFVTEALDEADAYEGVQALVVEQLQLDGLEGEDAPPVPIDGEAIVEAALPPSYVQAQTEANVESTYAYLHGETDELDLAVDLAPAKAAVADAVEDELASTSPSELVAMLGDEGADLQVEFDGVSLSMATMAAMAADESRFDAERLAVRDAIRATVVTAAVDEAFAAASNDELLALVIPDYDPGDYSEAEKDQLVADEEADIRAALAAAIEDERGDELDAAVEDQRADLRALAAEQAEGAVGAQLEGVEPAVADAATALVLVGVDGLLGDVTYEEYRASFDAATDDLAAAAATLVTAELDAQVPDELDLAAELGPEAEQGLADAREAVGILDLLVFVLPLVGLGLVGLVYLVTRSPPATAIAAGAGLVLGGLPALVGASMLPAQVAAALAGDELPATLTELVAVVVGRFADVVATQSAAVVVVGGVLVGAGLALHYDLVGGSDRGAAPVEE